MSSEQRVARIPESHPVAETRPKPAKAALRDAFAGNTTLPFLLKADEVAQLLRKSRLAIYAMTEREQLPGVTRIGRRVLYRRDDLLQWLDQNRAPSPKE